MKLTKEQRQAMMQVLDGADIYNRIIAKILRTVEKEHPEFIAIGKPQMYTGDGTDRMPYFGAILTSKGRKSLK